MTGIPNDTSRHLYTWVDVDDEFTRLLLSGQWPSWLREASAYWDDIELTVDDDVDEDSALGWLAERFGPLTIDRDRQRLLLEPTGNDDPDRFLTISWRHAEPTDVPVDRAPRWRERRIAREMALPLPRPKEAEFPGDVRLVCFQSFKGGVGRTLHCIALAREIASRGRRVLLIDADLEAPGITRMVEAQGGRTDFCLEDVLALLQGATDGDPHDAISLGRKFLLNQEADNIVVMPARHQSMRPRPPRIEPIDLLVPPRDPYFLTASLARLATAIDVDTVLIDLRAGTSELSAPILLDPRVHRVLVTTLSDQSVAGTCDLLSEIAARAPVAADQDPPVSVLVTQYEERLHGLPLDRALERLADCVVQTVLPADPSEATSDLDESISSELLTSPFVSQLLALPALWSEVCRVIDDAGVRHTVSPLADRFTSLAPPPLVKVSDDDSLANRRRRLADLADNLVFAETSPDSDPASLTAGQLLATESLVKLAEEHRTEPPIEIIIGAKGAGKTFTFLHMCAHADWSDFARTVGVTDVRVKSSILPVLRPQTAGALSPQHDVSPELLLRVRDLVQVSLEHDLGDIAWRRVWLCCLALSLGLECEPETAESTLTAHATTGARVIFAVDGLEELFREFDQNSREQRALYALLTLVADWLRSLRGRPFGLVVFVRRDLVARSIGQNVEQFYARYRRYELRWSRDEALRLAAWVANNAQAIGPREPADVRSASTAELVEMLRSLWGDQLGTAKSREARSPDWFIAALSDFQQQIQARDIVSFLAVAARESLDAQLSSKWQDRVLAPQAMRQALLTVSERKIREISEENPSVGRLFQTLRQLPSDSKKLPCDLSVIELTVDEARLLETNGVFFREDDRYWIPEIYRHGLGFATGNRPRILAVAKLVRKRNDVR
jgi:MinD-like ATPase involved in chromosome partitioning or flagellar assembly